MVEVLTSEEIESHRWVALHMARPQLDDATTAQFVAHLNDAELDRYRATPLAHGRDTFLVGRTLVRAALAAATGIGPAELALEATSDGKLLAPASGVHFNLSHCSSHFLVGLSRHPHVGVDIEDVRPYSPRMPPRFFLPDEIAHLDALPESERQAAFFHFWVVKEACIKAYGRTLGPSLATVPATPERRGRHGELAWEIVAIDDSVTAAIALEAPDDDDTPVVREVTPEEVLAAF
ncbi:MAG: 4'-phosphopantetheinyl transferase family protein [Actinomycetota bacterium]